MEKLCENLNAPMFVDFMDALRRKNLPICMACASAMTPDQAALPAGLDLDEVETAAMSPLSWDIDLERFRLAFPDTADPGLIPQQVLNFTNVDLDDAVLGLGRANGDTMTQAELITELQSVANGLPTDLDLATAVYPLDGRHGGGGPAEEGPPPAPLPDQLAEKAYMERFREYIRQLSARMVEEETAELDGQLKATEDKVDQLAAVNNKLHADYDALTADHSAVQGKLAELEIELGKLKVKHAGLTEQHDNTITNLQAERAARKREAQALGDAKAAAQALLEKERSKMEAMETRDAKLRARLDTIHAEHTAEVKDIKRRLQAAEVGQRAAVRDAAEHERRAGRLEKANTALTADISAERLRRSTAEREVKKMAGDATAVPELREAAATLRRMMDEQSDQLAQAEGLAHTQAADIARLTRSEAEAREELALVRADLVGERDRRVAQTDMLRAALDEEKAARRAAEARTQPPAPAPMGPLHGAGEGVSFAGLMPPPQPMVFDGLDSGVAWIAPGQGMGPDLFQGI